MAVTIKTPEIYKPPACCYKCKGTNFMESNKFWRCKDCRIIIKYKV